MEEIVTFVNYNDIFDIFIEKEEENIEIYNTFARMSENMELRKTFEQFVRYGMAHITELKEMRQQYPADNFSNSISVKINQTSHEPVNFKIMTYRDILEFAIEIEKKSEVLYHDMANQVNDEEVKKLLLKSSEEERRQRLRIEKMLDFEDSDSQ
ncbi:MAG: ferritin-like domain-containing protein [Bacteroidota bacterium]